MDTREQEFLGMALSVCLVLFTLFVVHRFIPSMMWAGVIAIATYPTYQKWRLLWGRAHHASAFFFTLMLALVLMGPLLGLITVLVRELQVFINFLQLTNRHGHEVPEFMRSFPWFSHEIQKYWNLYLSEPGSLKDAWSDFHVSLTPLSHYAKQISFNLFHRSFQVGFTLLCLFFFYRDAEHLVYVIHRIGEHCLGRRWHRYAKKLPSALRGTVNGTILVGLGVGLCMGLCYAFIQCPAPTVFGFVTACAAMIPFVVPFVILVVAILVWVNGSMLGAVVVLCWGTVVVFLADHFIKPVLIGGAIQLPFLAVLFSILGGVETMGLLGLFVGPMVMVLFLTLCQEAEG